MLHLTKAVMTHGTMRSGGNRTSLTHVYGASRCGLRESHAPVFPDSGTLSLQLLITQYGSQNSCRVLRRLVIHWQDIVNVLTCSGNDLHWVSLDWSLQSIVTELYSGLNCGFSRGRGCLCSVTESGWSVVSSLCFQAAPFTRLLFMPFSPFTPISSFTLAQARPQKRTFWNPSVKNNWAVLPHSWMGNQIWMFCTFLFLFFVV